jgi:hypothetical protein
MSSWSKCTDITFCSSGLITTELHSSYNVYKQPTVPSGCSDTVIIADNNDSSKVKVTLVIVTVAERKARKGQQMAHPSQINGKQH